MMGGLGAHEYMAPCAAGENEVALGPGYAANVEVAQAQPGVEQVGEEYFSGRRAADESSRRSRSATSSSSAPATPSRSARATSTSRAPSSRSGWAATGSAWRASPPPRSSSSPTSTASPGRARSRRSRCTWSALGKPGTPEREAAERCMQTLCAGRRRGALRRPRRGPGEKFADAELLGCPLRLTVGRRPLESGEIEVQVRRGRERRRGHPLDGEPAELIAGGGRAVAEPP